MHQVFCLYKWLGPSNFVPSFFNTSIKCKRNYVLGCLKDLNCVTIMYDSHVCL